MGCAFLILVLLGFLLFTAFALQFVTIRLVKVELSFNQACLVMFFVGGASVILTPISWLVFGVNQSADHPFTAQILADLATLPIVFPLCALLYGWLIKYDYPNTGKPIGWRNGLKIAGVMFLIRLVFAWGFTALAVYA